MTVPEHIIAITALEGILFSGSYSVLCTNGSTWPQCDSRSRLNPSPRRRCRPDRDKCVSRSWARHKRPRRNAQNSEVVGVAVLAGPLRFRLFGQSGWEERCSRTCATNTPAADHTAHRSSSHTQRPTFWISRSTMAFAAWIQKSAQL